MNSWINIAEKYDCFTEFQGITNIMYIRYAILKFYTSIHSGAFEKK